MILHPDANPHKVYDVSLDYYSNRNKIREDISQEATKDAFAIREKENPLSLRKIHLISKEAGAKAYTKFKDIMVKRYPSDPEINLFLTDAFEVESRFFNSTLVDSLKKLLKKNEISPQDKSI